MSSLPHILKLLDDPSESVRIAITTALADLGPDLQAALDELDPPPSDLQRAQIRSLLGDVVEKDEPADGQRFEIGQLVRHKRYGYRGVVVDIDDTCQADEQWYQRNQTQPEQDQPWYHVLADGSDQIYYPAESSLEPDKDSDPVENPYVAHFFTDFVNGRYLRNDRPWPENDA